MEGWVSVLNQLPAKRPWPLKSHRGLKSHTFRQYENDL